MMIKHGVDESNNLAVQEAREKAKQSFAEVSRYILDLLPTLEDALDRMSTQLEELKLESAVVLFLDFGNAVQSIANSLSTVFFENQDIEKINPHLANILENISSFVNKYEDGDISKIKSCLANELHPSFKAFRQELEAALNKGFPFS